MLRKLIFLLFVTTAVHGNPSLTCNYVNDARGYTAKVNVFNTVTPPYDSFTQCNGNHLGGFNDTDVTIVEIGGISPIIPSAICSQFPNVQDFYANNIQLKSIQHLIQCYNIIILDLSGNQITEIQANAFTNNQYLQKINLSSNSIVQTHENSFYNLSLLRVLDLSSNREISLPSRIFFYNRQLRELSLRLCGVTLININWFSNTTSLERLDLSQNSLSTLSSGTFYNLPNLLNLDLSSTELTELPVTIFYFNPRLLNLNLQSNKLTTLPSEVFRNQTRLNILRLSNNELTDIADNVFKTLENLQQLYMNNCYLTELRVEWFTNTPQLRTLSFRGNQISEIPYETFGVVNLIQELDFTGNNLSVFDATSFANLANLKNLRAENNKIDAVDHHFLGQPIALDDVFFRNNLCVNENIENFSNNWDENIKRFNRCFDNFDRKVIIFETTPNDNYRYFSIRWNTIVVHVKTNSSMQLALTNQKTLNERNIEILIGMDRNFLTSIYQDGKRVWNAQTQNIISTNDWTTFVISWNSGVLALYEAGHQLPFAIHIINEPFPINFIGIATGEYSSEASWQIHRIEGELKFDEIPPVIGNPSTPPEGSGFEDDFIFFK